MTQKIKGQQYTLMVADIKHAIRTSKQGKTVHLITFLDTDGSQYIAEEAENNPLSKFVKNVRNKFTLTNPGTTGPDWVRFDMVEGQPATAVGSSRENLFVAQTALNNAVLLGLQRGWDTEEILNQAFMFAGNIKQIANQLQEEMI